MLDVNIDNLRVYDAKGALVAASKYEGRTSLMTTGCKIQLIANDAVVDEITVVLLGDTNKDGKINASDYSTTRTIALAGNSSSLEICLQYANDVNKDGKVNASDYAVVRNAALAGTAIA